MLQDRTKQLFYLAFNFISTVGVTFVNKICFSRVEFGYPAMLSNVHLIVTFLGVEILRQYGSAENEKTHRHSSSLSSCEPPAYRLLMRDKDFVVLVLVVGMVNPLNNSSLKLNGIGFYQMFKMLVTPGVVFLEYILDSKILSLQRCACLVLVGIFVLVSSRADLQFSMTGTICASLWVPLAVMYKVQWGRVRKKYNCSTLSLMHMVLPFSIVVQMLISPFVDPPGIGSFHWTNEAIFWIGLSGVAAFLVNFSGFLVMGNIGALAHVLLGQLKSGVIMVGAYLFLGSNYTLVQLIGASGAVGAIMAYTYITVQEIGIKTKLSPDIELIQQTREDENLV